MRLSQLADRLEGSQILAISKAIKERKAAGEYIFNYTVGDFDPELFPIPEFLLEEIIKAYLQGYTNYPAAEGNFDLREAIALFTQSFGGPEYQPEEVIVASGGRPLIYAFYRCIVDEGDKVIYPVPSWNNQYFTILTNGIPVEIATGADNKFMPTAAQIEPHVKGAVLLSLCSPQNPTGTVFEKEELKRICELVVKENEGRKKDEKKLYVLFDQMYWLLMHGQNEHHSPVVICPDIKPYLVYVDAISKSFAATGVRVGWALGPSVIIQKMKAMLSHVGSWAPMAEQKATAKFLSNPNAIQEYLLSFKREIVKRLHRIYDGIMKLKKEGYPVDAIDPQAAIYLSLKIDIPGADKLLLNEAGIGLLPFRVFGSTAESSWYRISVGTCREQDIDLMLEKLKRALCPATTI